MKKPMKVLGEYTQTDTHTGSLNNGITLVALIVTIIVLIIIAGITIAQLTENGLLSKTTESAQTTKKSEATEKMNLKITEIQIDSYVKNETMPSLQYLADKLCEDNDIDYVLLQSKSGASLEKIYVGNSKSIFTKLKEYPFEFEINSSLQLASINGIKIATNNSDNVFPEDMDKTVKELLTIYINSNSNISLRDFINTDQFVSILNNKECVQYIAKNKEKFISDIANSEKAIIGFAKSTETYTLFKDRDWYNAIFNSEFASEFEENCYEIPQMTSATTPKGVASSNSENFPAWRAFDKVTGNSSYWLANTKPAWIQYEFENKMLAYKLKLYPVNDNTIYSFELLASNDSSDESFATILEDEFTNGAGNYQEFIIPFNKMGEFKYYRLNIKTTSYATAFLSYMNLMGLEVK